MTPAARRPPILLLAWLLLLPILVLVYLPSFSGPFLLDDHSGIIVNSEIRAVTLENIKSLFRSHRDVRVLDHRPVVALSFLLDYQWTQLEPFGYRVTNLFLHWLSAGLALLLLSSVWTHLRGQTPDATWGPLSVAYLWALHPLSSMPVAYISARHEAWMVLCSIASLWLLSRGREIPSLLAAVAAILSKEVAVTLPCALFTLDWLWHGGSFWSPFRRRPRYYAALTIAWGFLCYWHARGARRGHTSLADMPLSHWFDYFRAQCGVLVGYFTKLFWPADLQFYPWVYRIESWTQWVPHAVALSLLVALGAYFLWRGPRWAGFCLLWPFFILGPTSSFIPIPYEPAMEYRLFLPSLPLWGLLIYLLFQKLPRFALPLTLTATLAFATVSHLRARDYQSARQLYTQQLSVDPTSLFAWDAIAGGYLAEGRHDQAADAAARMITLASGQRAPDFLGRAYHFLGMIEFTEGRHDRAIEYFRQSIAVANTVSSKAVLAGLLLKRNEDAEAARLLGEVLAFVPDRADALFLLFELHLRANRFSEAESVLDKIADFHPGHPVLIDQQARLARRKSGQTSP